MSEVGSLWVRLRGDSTGFESAMAEASEQMVKTGKKMQDIGKSLSTSVTLPILAVGTLAITAATQVENAMSTIRAGTGATGDDLTGLGDDFRAVFAKVPEDAGQVSTAIADLNTRLGLTGEPLRQLTEQMLELADLTGTQVAPLIASATRVFGDWSVSTEQQSETLDTLFKVSQATGLGVDRLSDSLVQFGAPLRQMGFSLEESAVLMGKWEKEGVNAELVLGSFRIAMGNFARDNIPMREGLDQTMKKIQELGPSAEATALAMDVFGARAGPDMAAAILEGRFELDELMAQIEASPDTIARAGAETETFAEKLANFRNQTTLALEPFGVRLMDAFIAIQPQITAVIGMIAGLVERFAALSPETQTTILIIVGLVGALGPLLVMIGSVVTALGSMGGALVAAKAFLFGTAAVAGGAAAKVGILSGAITFLKGVLVPLKIAFLAVTAKVWIVIAVVAALAAGVYLLIKNWDAVRGFFTNLWASVTTTFNNARRAVLDIVQGLWDAASGRFRSFVSSIAQIVSGVTEAIAAPFRRASTIVSDITNKIGGFLQRINPFARFSPSLVDNVRAGVRVIQEEYATLERLQLPKLAATVTPQAVVSGGANMATAAGHSVYDGPLFTIQNMTVRNEADIDVISRQLHRHIQSATRARGI